ncbi:hypothetical protein BL250_14510 [Erwinia sp. OLTSP20]|uniref:sugar glycosyltransferase n=1 Tax=unclassified Erwinia TaxID=2622719 RepID=UPI000C40E8F7|nr:MULTISPECIES: sugar glycosyltransferase [unclassified Erwinia]PIJ50214.1 hypothetical protein BV501_09025 [Erwinia sp. OAMSP11]PIJ72051.1 hypothetical protein BK416_09925 [Erwinia sp. OLSSP12]PIJ81342.1 hypothetical protein BLD47_08750 [Erwinia sp. OLCASP19]PIJ84048.1 hypothetical protein BLD46_08330 [Erwinia sp. OLMTSP26]PIJ85747.1 hypothetical protein BLD49_09550 [Erwinia sp. OLMDSP33]
MNGFYKFIYRYTHPRSYRHNETLWPYIRITRNQTEEIAQMTYKGQRIKTTPLSELRNKYTGDVMLAVSGPSVNTINFSDMPEMHVMGVNGSWALKNTLAFNFYIIVDMHFFDIKPDIVEEIVATPDLYLFTTAHGIKRILERTPAGQLHCKLVFIEDAHCRIYQPQIAATSSFTQSENGLMFSRDIRRGVCDAGTVAYWALQVLYFLGFNRIIIAGLDMKDFDKPRFYETVANKLPTFLPSKVDALILPAFRLARRVFDEKNIALYNLSLNSAVSSEIFPKATLQEIFSHHSADNRIARRTLPATEAAADRSQPSTAVLKRQLQVRLPFSSKSATSQL